MGDKPIWEQIGSSFVQHYYQLFDTDRTQLGSIYVSIVFSSFAQDSSLLTSPLRLSHTKRFLKTYQIFKM